MWVEIDEFIGAQSCIETALSVVLAMALEATQFDTLSDHLTGNQLRLRRLFNMWNSHFTFSHNCRTEFTTNEAVDAEVQQLKKDLFSMRIKFAKREEYNPAAMKATRQRVAQLLTIRRERELANGIDKRDSRAAEKARLVEAGLGKFA